MKYFEITDKAKEIRLQIEEAICIISEHMGLDEATLNSQAESRLNHSRSNYHLVNVLFENDLGGQVNIEELTEHFSIHQINRMQENGLIEEIDPDEILILRVYDAFTGFGDYVDIEAIKDKVGELPENKRLALYKIVKETDYKFKHEILRSIGVL